MSCAEKAAYESEIDDGSFGSELVIAVAISIASFDAGWTCAGRRDVAVVGGGSGKSGASCGGLYHVTDGSERGCRVMGATASASSATDQSVDYKNSFNGRDYNVVVHGSADVQCSGKADGLLRLDASYSAPNPGTGPAYWVQLPVVAEGALVR